LIGETPAELLLWERPATADQWYESVLRQELVQDQAAKIRSIWFSPGHHDLHLEFPERVAEIFLQALRDGFFK